MATQTTMSGAFKPVMYLLLLAIVITCASSARILDDDPPAAVPPEPSNHEAPPVDDDAAPTPASSTAVVPQPTVSGAATSTATVANADSTHALSFFMHNVLGGSHPSARVEAGILTSPGDNNNLPFAKKNGGVFPINGGVPLTNVNNGVINNNNLPFLAGLGGQTATNIISNNGNGNNVNVGSNGLPFVNSGSLPAGTTLQKLMFGTITVIDDELTEGHELGSSVVGKAQGFYVASSEDSTSQTMAFTAIFENGHYEDSISFFGVHRTVSPECQVAIIGGTGKYADAKGYATVKTIHLENQHTTDGVETLLQLTVYLSD